MKKKIKISSNPATNWFNNNIQFPRLLAELYAAGVLLQPALVKQLEESMDLKYYDIEELFERAQSEWDDIKARTHTHPGRKK